MRQVYELNTTTPIRSHPGPSATASYGASAIPPWITDWLRESRS